MPTPPWTVESLVARSAYSILDVRLEIGARIPPHVNRDQDLVVHLVEGEVELDVDRGSERLSADASLEADDRTALLAAAGITRLPAG